MNKEKGRAAQKVRRSHYELEVLRKQYAILKGQGMLQRDIAKRLGVCANTISDWHKSLPISGYFTIRVGMQKRLIAMTEDKSTPAMDIYNLANALAAIDKTIDRYTNTTTTRIKSVSK